MSFVTAFTCWVVSVAVADQSISGGGIFMKVQGQSGKMTFASSEPIGSAADKVEIEMDQLKELASDGTVLGSGGRAKHSFNSFATQEFTFSDPIADTIKGVEKDDNVWVAKDYNVTKVSFTSYLGEGTTSDSKLIIDAIIFTEDTYLQFTTPFGGQKIEQKASAGSVKFNVRMSQWNWCADDCTSSNGVGDAVRLTVKMTNQIVSSVAADNSSNSSCDGGCSNGAVQDLGGVFVSILNVYSVENADGTVTDYSMPTKPSLTLSPEPGQENGASQRVSTLVLEFPRTNFGANDTLIYDPMLSYEPFTETPSNPESTPVSFATESHLLGFAIVATTTILFG